MSILGWLHLSDLHFRARSSYDEDVVLRALMLDVAKCVKEDGLHLDFIVVSGDIASASKPEEYDMAEHFFDDLLRVTGLSKDRLFPVPGNHDVDRSEISPLAAGAAAILDNRDSVNRCLAADADRELIFQRFHNYQAFVNRYLGPRLTFSPERYFYVKRINVAEQNVAILGLNSAWLAASDGDRNQLVLGERQIRTALNNIGDADLRVAVMHHPFDWLQDFDRRDAEALLCKGCDFVLHGHMHQVDLLEARTPDCKAMFIAAGACYETRKYPNSYNMVQLDSQANQGTVHLRTYSDQQGGFWTKDVSRYQHADDGQYAFSPSLLVNAAAKRDRLQPAQVTVTSKANLAKLDAVYPPRREAISLERGGIIPDLFDASIHFDAVRVPIREKILEELRSGAMLSCSHSYYTEQGTGCWLSLCNDPQYEVYRKSTRLLSEHSDRILKGLGPKFIEAIPDFVSLGPGNGQKDRILLKSLVLHYEKQGSSSEFFYYPVDISIQMLAAAIKNVCSEPKLRTRLRIKAVVGDFLRLMSIKPVYDYRSAPNLFSFLGNTLGNIPDEVHSLKKLKNAMCPGDFMLLEVRLYAGAPKLGGDNQDQFGLSFAPLAHLGIEFDESRICLKEESRLSPVPNTKTLAVHYRDVVIGEEPFGDVVLSCVNYYDRDELRRTLENTTLGFEVVDCIDDNFMALFILRNP